MVERVNGTVVECNTAYEGARNTTEKHKKLMEEHEWSKYFNVDIMDEEGPDMELEIPMVFKLRKTMLVNIWLIMIQCWYYPILKVMRWEALVEL